MGLFDALKKKKKTKKPTLDFEKLEKKADEGYKLITAGKKDKLNFVETRCLVYGVDFVKWARETFNILEKIEKSELENLDEIMKKLKQAVSNEQIDKKTEFGYFSGIVGVFGILLQYYKDAKWIDELRDDDGYKMMIDGKVVEIEKEIGGIYDGRSEIDSLKDYFEILIGKDNI